MAAKAIMRIGGSRLIFAMVIVIGSRSGSRVLIEDGKPMIVAKIARVNDSMKAIVRIKGGRATIVAATGGRIGNAGWHDRNVLQVMFL